MVALNLILLLSTIAIAAPAPGKPRENCKCERWFIPRGAELENADSGNPKPHCVKWICQGGRLAAMKRDAEKTHSSLSVAKRESKRHPCGKLWFCDEKRDADA